MNSKKTLTNLRCKTITLHEKYDLTLIILNIDGLRSGINNRLPKEIEFMLPIQPVISRYSLPHIPHHEAEFRNFVYRPTFNHVSGHPHAGPSDPMLTVFAHCNHFRAKLLTVPIIFSGCSGHFVIPPAALTYREHAMIRASNAEDLSPELCHARSRLFD